MAKSNVRRRLLIFALIFLCISLYGTALALHDRCLDRFWLTAGICFITALASGATLWNVWRKITDIPSFPLNFLINAVFMTPLLMSAFYGMNILLAKEPMHPEPAVVQRLYYDTRYHSRRVSRDTYTRGEAYKVYFVEVEFGNGKRKEFTLKHERWRRVHLGDTLKIPMTRGFFGVSVISPGASVDIPTSDYTRQFRGK